MKISLPKKIFNFQLSIFNSRLKSKGFTLIELLVVIGVLTVLLAIVLIAINPARQFSQANDTQRRSDVNAILNAVHQYAADNKGSLPAGIDSTTRTICSDGGSVSCPVNIVDLCATDYLVPTYLADLPIDPTDGEKDPSDSLCTTATGYNTAYTVVSSATNNRITVTATGEIVTPISVTR